MRIEIKNVNDNPPVFLPYENKIQIQEELLVPGCITKVEAYDPDIPDREADQNISYFVVKAEQQKLLSIDKNGCLILIKVSTHIYYIHIIFISMFDYISIKSYRICVSRIVFSMKVL